jgi:fatty-acyl-CoA synthase
MNDTAAGNALSPFSTPGDALAAHAANRPDAEAMVFPQSGARMTFGEWHERATALARALLDLGIAPGDHIAILAESRIEWPVAQLGIALMGGVMVPLNTYYQRDDLSYALNQSHATALFLSSAFRNNRYLETVQDLRADVPGLRTLIVFDGDHADTESYNALIAAGSASGTALPDVSPDAVASLQYTSGTTGFPKGALLTHAGMLANAWGISGRLNVTADDRWTSIIPLFHCAGCIMCVLGTVQRGSCYVGVPSFAPTEMFEIVQGEKCTMLSGVPTSHIAMLEHPDRGRYDLSTLRAGTCGGADTDPDLLRRCAEGFPLPGVVQVYGQTEASTLISLADCAAPERFDTCGPPLPGADVRITDPETGAAMPAGEIGQIETSGPMVMRGYYGNADATAETIAEDGWMRTGDLGYLTEDGNIVVAGGRLRDMIIRGGENIYPVEIENMLRAHPAVSDIAVFAVPDRYYGEIVGAAITLAAEVTAEELRTYCDGRIAKFKVPANFYRVDEFPLTASGKIRKTELRDMAGAETLTPLE